VLIAATALYPIMMFWAPWHLGAIDFRPVWSGYLGLVIFSSAAVAIGLLLSALTESQVIAFFITWALLALFTFLGWIATKALPAGTARDVLNFISFDARLAPFARGQIITRDVIYFLSITVGCLMAAFRALERRKWA
jgi:ABC-2 type transport system permease protein